MATTTTATATLKIINMRWVYLCFSVSVLLISTLAVSSASARRLVPSETQQQTTLNPDKYSSDFHEESSGSASGREEGPYESDNNDTFEISTKVPRSADYGNMDEILSVPAESKNANFVDIGEHPSLSEHNNADHVVPKNADYVNMDEFSRVFEPKNADHVVPKNADYVDIDGIPSISSPHYESDIDGDIHGVDSSIDIQRPMTDEPDHEEQFESSIYEPDHEEQFESKDSAKAIKPAGSSDSANAMEAAAGMPIH